MLRNFWVQKEGGRVRQPHMSHICTLIPILYTCSYIYIIGCLCNNRACSLESARKRVYYHRRVSYIVWLLFACLCVCTVGDLWVVYGCTHIMSLSLVPRKVSGGVQSWLNSVVCWMYIWFRKCLYSNNKLVARCTDCIRNESYEYVWF